MAELAGLDLPPDGTADIWWARRQDASDRHAGLLDATERRRWAAYRRDQDRTRFLAGCALAKAALARYAGLRPADVRFDRTCGQCGEPHGKPVLEGGLVDHSVAHSGDLIAVAVARAPAEQAVLAAIPPAGRARAFLVAWTRKEAVTKATGDGLRAAFSDVVVAADAGPPRLVSWPYERSVHSVSLLDLDADPGFVAALAVIGRCETVRARDGSALLAGQT